MIVAYFRKTRMTLKHGLKKIVLDYFERIYLICDEKESIQKNPSLHMPNHLN